MSKFRMKMQYLETVMVTGITDKVAIQEFVSHAEKDSSEVRVNLPVDEVGNPVVVSKDFILNMLSLAIGKPFFLDGNLGSNVDVKV